MTGNNPMSFFSDNVDAWGPLEWFDRLAKAVHARNRSVRDKDDLSFELYQNIASSSATRLVSDFEDKVRMALTTLRELEKANVAYVDANTELFSTLESLQRANEELRQDRDRTARNRDMWKGQVERQADRLSKFRDEEIRLREILFKCGSFIADRYQEGDAEYQVVLLVNDAICRTPALASTGGEHHAE
ncbi:hypothetical protein ACI2J5_00095 [Agrobacterium pusense]|uniref:hypothetical protein n=1 Tax=Agrobacterium pusense TaxID=648995 RepID=UPI00384D6D3A